MDFSSLVPYAPSRNDVGHVVFSRAPSQAMPGVHDGSIDIGPGDDQRPSTARLEGHLRILMHDDREVIIPLSDVKCVLGLSGAVLWTHPLYPKFGAQRTITSKGSTTLMAMATHSQPGQNITSSGAQGRYNTFESIADPAAANVDIEHSGGHVQKDWPSQSNQARPNHSSIQGNSSSFQDRKESFSRSAVVPPIDDSLSWNSLRPNNTVVPFSTDQHPNVEQHYNQYRNNQFGDAHRPGYSAVPTIHVNQALDTAPSHANIFSFSTLYGLGGPHRPEYASVRPDMVAQALHPRGNPFQADLGLERGHSPTCQNMDHIGPFYGSLSQQEAPMPDIAIGTGAAYLCQELAMPDKQQVTVGLPSAPPQLHPANAQLESDPLEQPGKGLKAPRSAAHKAVRPGKSKGRRKGPLNAAQKEHAKIVRNAGPKKCDCSQRKVKCTHVVEESPQSPGAQGPGTFLAATHAQRESAIYGEPDTPSSQNTSWLTDTSPLSPFSPSRNQSFGNTADLDMSPLNLWTENYQPFGDDDDAEGDMEDEEMLEMDKTPNRPFQ